MPDDKRKINCWIPVSLYDKIEPAGYENTTQAIITALQRLLEDPQEDITGYKQDIEGYKQDIEGYKQDIEGYLKDIAAITTENSQLKEDLTGYQKDIEKHIQDISGYKQDIKALNNEIDKLKDDLSRAPDLVEFSQLQARYEGLQEIIREKDRSIERLENYLNKAGQREEDLKQMHNNYFLQVQTLINQRAISAPVRSTQKEEHSSPETTKNTLEKVCLNCGKTFTATRSTRMYCSGACKSAYSRKMKK